MINLRRMACWLTQSWAGPAYRPPANCAPEQLLPLSRALQEGGADRYPAQCPQGPPADREFAMTAMSHTTVAGPLTAVRRGADWRRRGSRRGAGRGGLPLRRWGPGGGGPRE